MLDTALLTEPEVLGEPPGDADDTTGARSRKRLPHLITGAVTLLLATLAAVCDHLGRQNRSDRDVQAAGTATQPAAQDYAATLASVDSNNLEANLAAVLEGATSEFHDMYRQSSSQLRQTLIARKATGHRVDQTVTNTDIPDPRADRSRSSMTMRRIDGQWKAVKAELP